MSKAIADLLNEHEAISSAIRILERMTANIKKTSSVDAADMQAFIDFLKEFADKCHHGKEEQYLFPAMEAAGIPNQGGPIGVMLAEHVQGRQLIREMEASLAAGDLVKLARAAGAYAVLLRVHIRKENTALFPMAEKVLSEAQLETLYMGFEDLEQNVIGQGRHEQLHAVLKRLEEKYPPE
jgi:hemerythrin-like domain-containing protein